MARLALALFVVVGMAAIVPTAQATPFPGPDGFGYVGQNIPEELRTLSDAATVLDIGDDDVAANVPIGFTFSFYGTNYTLAQVSSNGFISFTPGVDAGCCGGQPLPTVGGIDNLAAAFWTDICPSTGGYAEYCFGTIRYETLDAAPNREFVVDYDFLSYCCEDYEGTRVKFQIILHEGTNAIEFQNGRMDDELTYDWTVSTGIENATGTVGLQVIFGLEDLVTARLEHSGILIQGIPQACVGMTFDKTIVGTTGNDTINGTGLRELILGLEGNDVINGGAGNDCIVGGDGNDTLNGGSGNDKLFGGIGTDTLKGDSGTDTADGGPGTDTCDAESRTSCP